MPANARQYRDDLYRLRAHPPKPARAHGRDERDSFVTVYLSILPFLATEYWVEAIHADTISGLIFPTGYLIFWAFFYSFYRPGVLESRLSSPMNGNLKGVPIVLMGAAIWLVKATVMEFGSLVFLGRKLATQKRPPSQPHRPQSNPHSRPSPGAGQRQYQERRASAAPGPRPPSGPPPLPQDVLGALRSLGLKETRDWEVIHRRYRELAKRFHPDLNPDITAIGNRFIAVDAAYRKLSGVKDKYFPQKRSFG